jgi:hypothetical protein
MILSKLYLKHYENILKLVLIILNGLIYSNEITLRVQEKAYKLDLE